MDRPEEQQERLKGDDDGKGLVGFESASSAELENKTVERPDLDGLSEGESGGDFVPKATIIPEDDTPPEGPTEAERDFETIEPFTQGPAEKETEATSDDVSSPEAFHRKDRQGPFGWLKKYQKPVGTVVIGLFVLSLVYGLGGLVTRRHGQQERMPAVQVYWSPVEKGASDMMSFDRFLVFLPRTDERIYLLTKISVKPSKPSVYEEMDEKRTFFRASIYAVLNKEVSINRGQEISMKILKPAIINALNTMLVTGTIDGIYFTEFLVV